MGIFDCLVFRKKGRPIELLDVYKADRLGDVNAGHLSSAGLNAICSRASAHCQASAPQDTVAQSLLRAIISSSPDAISIYDLSSGKILISNAPSQSLPVPRDTDTLESVFAQDPNSLKQALSNIKHGIYWRGLIPVGFMEKNQALPRNTASLLLESKRGRMPDPGQSQVAPLGRPSVLSTAHSRVTARRALQLAACPSLVRTKSMAQSANSWGEHLARPSCPQEMVTAPGHGQHGVGFRSAHTSLRFCKASTEQGVAPVCRHTTSDRPVGGHTTLAEDPNEPCASSTEDARETIKEPTVTTKSIITHVPAPGFGASVNTTRNFERGTLTPSLPPAAAANFAWRNGVDLPASAITDSLPTSSNINHSAAACSSYEGIAAVVDPGTPQVTPAPFLLPCSVSPQLQPSTLTQQAADKPSTSTGQQHSFRVPVRRNTSYSPSQLALLEALTTSTWSTRLESRRAVSAKRVVSTTVGSRVGSCPSNSRPACRLGYGGAPHLPACRADSATLPAFLQPDVPSDWGSSQRCADDVPISGAKPGLELLQNSVKNLLASRTPTQEGALDGSLLRLHSSGLSRPGSLGGGVLPRMLELASKVSTVALSRSLTEHQRRSLTVLPCEVQLFQGEEVFGARPRPSESRPLRHMASEGHTGGARGAAKLMKSTPAVRLDCADGIPRLSSSLYQRDCDGLATYMHANTSITPTSEDCVDALNRLETPPKQGSGHLHSTLDQDAEGLTSSSSLETLTLALQQAYRSAPSICPQIIRAGSTLAGLASMEQSMGEETSITNQIAEVPERKNSTVPSLPERLPHGDSHIMAGGIIHDCGLAGAVGDAAAPHTPSPSIAGKCLPPTAGAHVNGHSDAGSGGGGDGRGGMVPDGGSSLAGIERWHEVVVSGLRHPVTGAQLVMVTQHDVSARVWAEQQLARVMEAEHALLEAIFPAHVLEHIAITAAALAAEVEDENGGLDGGRHPAARPTLQGLIVAAAAEAKAAGLTPSISQQEPEGNGTWEPLGPTLPITGDTFLHLATSHTALTILFCDIQGFTSMCNVVKPATVMAFLNDLYTRLDAMLDAFGVYKVETIGDCYVAAGGLMKVDPDTGAVTVRSDDVDPQHAHRTVQFAKALLRAAAAVRLPTTGEPVRLRVGIHSGPAMSGVVGTRMPRFCLFGDTINTASRMESTGLPGAIHVSQATRDLLPHEQWEPTGGIEAKGKGVLQTYLLRPPLPGQVRNMR